MEKYKDFEDLPDTYDEQTLIELFIKRNYVQMGFDHRNANDIIISKDIIDGKIAYDPENKTSFRVSTYDERMIFWKELFTGALQFPSTFELEQAKSELSRLNPSEIADRYLRKKVEPRVKAYLKICKKIIKENRLPEEEVKFKIEGINISNLIKELQKWNFFDRSYYNDYDKNLFNWFKGAPPAIPIPLNVSANIFISLIADAKDHGYIKNSKEFCYSYIEKSFLFNAKKAKISYIKKVMRPKGEGRVSFRDKKIPDIQLFDISK